MVDSKDLHSAYHIFCHFRRIYDIMTNEMRIVVVVGMAIIKF